MQDISEWSKNLRVEVRGDEVASHAGTVIPRMLADATGLTSALSAALSRPEVTHDRGAVLRDVAVAIADGTDCISDARVLRDQPRVFGPVASIPTMWRSLNEIDDPALQRITLARNATRQRVWELIAARHGADPTGAHRVRRSRCGDRDPHRRHPDRGVLGQTVRGGELQGRLRVSSTYRVV